MGRPKKYTQQFIEEEAKALLAYAKRVPVPFEKEFSSKRGYSSQRLSEFAKESEEFSEALKKMKDLQEVKIVKAALTGKVIASVAIFTLKNVAGWRDAPQDNKNEKQYDLIDVIKKVAAEEEELRKKGITTGHPDYYKEIGIEVV